MVRLLPLFLAAIRDMIKKMWNKRPVTKNNAGVSLNLIVRGAVSNDAVSKFKRACSMFFFKLNKRAPYLKTFFMAERFTLYLLSNIPGAKYVVGGGTVVGTVVGLYKILSNPAFLFASGIVADRSWNMFWKLEFVQCLGLLFQGSMNDEVYYDEVVKLLKGA
jgi:hypothetical protein